MSKIEDKTIVLRLQSGKNVGGLQGGIKDWGKYTQAFIYDDDQINAIESSNPESLNQPTSIPSPFARIALVKTAFYEVAEHGEKTLKAYQKIVSDSLDVAEIFFTYEKWKDKIDIVKWDNDTDLKKLETGHKILHKTLKTFLNNDAQAYNFDKMRCIYILKYKATGDMIGATSPCTLFFSSANEFKGDIHLSHGHKAFSDIFPLHKRSWDFQKYLYTWLAANNENRDIDGKAEGIFKEVHKYLRAQRPLTNKVEEIDNIFENEKTAKTNLQQNYEQIAGYEILGKAIYKQQTDSLQLIVSDFKIKTTLQSGKLPLVLPLEGGNGSGYEDWQLTEITQWAKFKADIHADRNILPDGTHYNWLTINDFLEEKIIRLPYEIQSQSFFDGNLSGGKCYLLPLKDQFFNYFTTEELKKIIKIEGGDKIVTVKLQIPVERGTIDFKKEYKASEITLVETSFDCVLFPNVRFDDEKDAFYRFGLLCPYESKDKEKDFSVKFYSGSRQIELNDDVEMITRNVSDVGNAICKTYSLNQKSFDRLKINVGSESGVLIPYLPSKGVSEQFTFSVDFGTTNSHIEYKTSSDNNIQPFEISEADKQIHFLNGKNDYYKLVSDVDFIPVTIGAKEKFKFPFRTALSLAKNKEKAMKVFPFVQANVVIPYEKRKVPKYNEILTQLKWESDEHQMSYFIDSLCFMLRNKVAINGGDLSATKLVWFYPLSMAGVRSKTIANIWKLSYAKYFLGIAVNSIDMLEDKTNKILNDNLKELPESIAPYLYYEDNNQFAISNLVSIDIGGETCDTVFVKNKKVEYVTSFRFATNSIFGLGEYISPIVSKYQASIEKIIKDNDENFKLENLYNSIKSTKYSDLASFFFSLSDNEMLQNVQINFHSMLKEDKNQKSVFVLFFAAIIYHIAQILKTKQQPMPRHITFSGNGSRIVNIIADNEVLAELSKSIFEKIFGQKYGSSGLDIIHNTINPKEVTCKGGIKAADKNYKQTPFESVVLLGTDDSTCATDNTTYATINVEEYAKKTVVQVKKFVAFVIDDLLNQKYTKGVVAESYVKALNINPQTLKIVKEICQKEDDLNTFTSNGIRDKIEKVNAATQQIEESFFFYPMRGLLNALSKEINKMD